MQKLNLGAGSDIKDGFDNHDYKSFEGINIVFNLDKYPYPVKANSYDFILCNHVLEHVEDLFKTFDELHRISKSNAIIQIEVPHFSTNFAFTQIDHRHYFGLDSLSILEESDPQRGTYPFKVISQKIYFRGSRCSLIMRAISFPINVIINSSHFIQLMVDRFVSKIIPFYFIEYKVKTIKTKGGQNEMSM